MLFFLSYLIMQLTFCSLGCTGVILPVFIKIIMLVFHKSYSTCGFVFDLLVEGSELHVCLLCSIDHPPTPHTFSFYLGL